MNAEIISVGTELLRGEIVDTNSAFLAGELASLSVEVLRHTTVGDDEEPLVDAVRRAVLECEAVIITGGIGPTPDDITRRAVARVARVPLVERPEVLEHIAEMFRAWGREMSPANALQAQFPDGSTVIPNPRGIAPGFEIHVRTAHVFVMPGVPSEMKAMWHDSVRPMLAVHGVASAVVRTVNCFGRGESDITEAIKDLMAPGMNPSVGDTAEEGVIKVRIRAQAATYDEALALADGTKAEVAGRLGEAVFGYDDDTLASVVLATLLARGQTVAVAESCTGGLVSKQLTDIPGSSAAFLEGIVAYSNEAKTKLLGVPASLIAAHGAVSDQVARAMAERVKAVSGADYGLSVTGIAGPGGATAAKPVGLVYIAAASASGTTSRELRLGGDRAGVRDRAAKWVLNSLRLALTSS